MHRTGEGFLKDTESEILNNMTHITAQRLMQLQKMINPHAFNEEVEVELPEFSIDLGEA